MKCETCKFAKWVMTTTGRKSPLGHGQCSWEKTFTIAASARNPMIARPNGEPLTLKGGYICRKIGEEYPTKNCGTWQPTESKVNVNG